VAAALKPVYLFSGTDRPKIEEAIRRLKDRVGESAAEVLAAGDASGEDVVAACNAQGLFATEGRAVVVNDVERWRSADAKALERYLRDPAPATVLALVADGIKRESQLAKLCAKAGEAKFYDVPKSKLPSWVGQRFRQLGAHADQEACRLLVELVGDNVVELDNEVRKLATWAAEETVDATAVSLLAAGRAEVEIFALTDAWGARDVVSALSAAERILERPTGTRRDEISRIVGRLAAHVQRVRESQALAAAGLSPREGASRLKRNPYYVQKLFAQASSFTAEELENALVRVAALDLAVKGESKLPSDLELDRALVEATRATSAPRPETN
jgi:DNA polymerase III subunit delta